MYTLVYEESTGFIYSKNENGVQKLLEDHFSGKPVISPDGKRAIYISPLEWEVESRLYIFDLKMGIKEEIELDIDKTMDKVKDVAWIDDNQLVLIIGGIGGTVAIGGNIYQYDMERDFLFSLTGYEDNRKQAIKLHVKNQSLVFDMIEYTDHSMNRFIRKQGEIPLTNAV